MKDGPADIYSQNICFSISMYIAFLPFEVPNHNPPLHLAQDYI